MFRSHACSFGSAPRLNLVERSTSLPRPLLEAICDLARAVEALARYLEASG
jgi:hypothetical protein